MLAAYCMHAAIVPTKPQTRPVQPLITAARKQPLSVARSPHLLTTLVSSVNGLSSQQGAICETTSTTEAMM